MSAAGSWTFEVNPAGIEATTGPMGLVHLKGMLVIGRRIERIAKELCPVDTGRLRSSIAARVEVEGGKPLVIVGTNVEYAIYVHEGTGIYGPRGRPIEPVNAKVLAWTPRGGSTVFARSVKGMKGRPFLEEAMVRAAR